MKPAVLALIVAPVMLLSAGTIREPVAQTHASPDLDQGHVAASETAAQGTPSLVETKILQRQFAANGTLCGCGLTTSAVTLVFRFWSDGAIDVVAHASATNCQTDSCAAEVVPGITNPGDVVVSGDAEFLVSSGALTVTSRLYRSWSDGSIDIIRVAYTIADGVCSSQVICDTELVGAGPAPCPGNLDGDGEVGVQDLVELILNWGECPD